MSDKINDGGPAFPANSTNAHDVAYAACLGIEDVEEKDRVYLRVKAQALRGMSLRDYFAGQALAAVILDEVKSGKLETTENRGTDGAQENQYSTIATDAYALADAMLAEREASK